MSRPNILFLLSDQHSARVLGHAGDPNVKTPHLDRLAAGGVRFTRAMAPNPICSPTRVSLLSGQYCHNHGYYGLDGPLTGRLPNVLGHFRSHGYRTGAIGKIHLPAGWINGDCDVLLDFPDYAQYLEERGLTAVRDDGVYPEQNPAIGQSWDGRKSALAYEDSVEGWVSRETRQFMRDSVKAGKPFIIEASMPRPHQIYAPSGRFWDMYDGPLQLPPNADADLSRKAPHLRELAETNKKGGWTQFEPRTFEAGRLRKLRGYLGCVSQVDHAVGEMLAVLDELGIADNTIVVYTSDHGDYATEFGIMEKAPGICSDAICRVPMIWRAPGCTKTGHTSDALVQSFDWVDTVCELAGVGRMPSSDGVDLSPLLRGGSCETRRVAVTEHPWSKSLVRGKWRYVHYPRGMFAEHPDGFGELYDLEKDPWEMENLWFDPEHRAVVTEMKAELLDWMITTARCGTFTELFTDGVRPQEFVHHMNLEGDGKVSPEALRATCDKGLTNYI